MKSKVIRLSASVLLTALLSASLVACGSKKEVTSTASSKTSTSVVAKSSSSKKANQSTSKSQASSSQAAVQDDSQPEQGSSANTAVDQAQGNANQEAVQENASSTQAADAAVPAELVGTWTGSSQQASEVTMTIDAAGNVTTTANFNVDYEPNRTSSTTAKAVQVADNLYVWEGGDFSTLMPGITGLGGAGFQAKPGFYLQNGQYTPVQFTSPLGDTFDYSNYHAFPFSLSK